MLARLSNRRTIVETVQKYQNQLLAQARQAWYQIVKYGYRKGIFGDPTACVCFPLSKMGKKRVAQHNADNLIEHLARLYASNVLILSGDDFVRYSLNDFGTNVRVAYVGYVAVRAGAAGLRAGAGSGWNAALMGHLVGPSGHVYSLSIIPELARQAAKHQGSADQDREYHRGDGETVMLRASPMTVHYDRWGPLICRDIYQQIKEDGLLLIVIKIEAEAILYSS